NKRQLHVVSFSLSPSNEDGTSNMTMVIEESDQHKMEQLIKQFQKQIDVMQVADITDDAMVARELALIKVRAGGHVRSEIQGIITPFRASVIDISKDTLTVQVTGTPDKVEALVALLEPYSIINLNRTGITACLRGQQSHVTDIHAPVFV